MKKLIIFSFLMGAAPLYAQRCVFNLSLTSPETSFMVSRKVSNKIETSAAYEVGSGYNVTLRAGVLIEMKPNTYIKSGSNFAAVIQDCYGPIIEPGPKGSLSDSSEIVKTYPNPVTGILNVTAEGDAITEVSVATMTGRLVETRVVKYETSLQLDFSKYPPGIYLLTANLASGNTVRHKIYK